MCENYFRREREREQEDFLKRIRPSMEALHPGVVSRIVSTGVVG